MRFKKGSFVFVHKHSEINDIGGEYNAYSAIHQKMSFEEYKEFVSTLKLATEEVAEADEVVAEVNVTEIVD